MAVIQAELRRDAAAKLLLERALTVNPTYPPALFNLALQYEEQGDRARALELFRQILEIDPSWHDALVRIAHAETVRDPDGEIVRKLVARAAPLEPRSAHAREPAFRARQGASTTARATKRGLLEQYALGNAGEPAAPARATTALRWTRPCDRVIRESSARSCMAQATPVSEAPLVFYHRHVPLRLDALRAGCSPRIRA